MQLVINGDPHDLPGPLSVSALLAHLAIDPRRVAVEVNETVIKKARYDETRVEPDDRVEIVNFVGGG
jgi:sulfur carrier protein